MNPDGPGDCYEVAGQLVVIDKVDGVLCHGTPLGTGGEAEGLRYGHAWVEVNIIGATFVIDKSNGNDAFFPKDVYYRAGSIVDEDVVRYSRVEAARHIVKYKHWGPWPLKKETAQP